jgi:fructose-bisphosphate aldolase class II
MLYEKETVHHARERRIPPANAQPQEETMPLSNPKQMFADAYAGGYAIGAFNVNNMEIIQGIMSAASEEKSPVILQVSAGARKYAGQIYIMKLVEAALSLDPSIPVVVHLDHGPSFEMCRDCIDGGFTSVMIDGSHLPFEENIALTKQVVDYAHPRGVWVEAELGKLAGIEEHVQSAEHVYTDPDEAVQFVERTGCDSLAVAIGTSHGAYKFKGEAKLDFDRLETIGKKLPGYPLVLHGASSVPQEFVEQCNKYGGQVGGARGVPEDMLRKAAGMGVCKINVDTDIRLAVTASIRQHFTEHPEHFDPRQYLTPAREAVKNMVARKIRTVMGSSGKA